MAIVLLQCFFVLVFDLIGTLVWSALHSSLFTADCSGPSLLVKPLNPNHVAFTARSVRVGHKVEVSGRWAGDWAIGIVQESFWGLPALTPRLVFLENQMSSEGETYFISGMREHGILTRFLPIVDARPCGSHYYGPVADAKIYLRLLRNPPPQNQFRIIG